ncbi:MAG: SsrA-binding protein SmpB [Bacteroidota bacterium]|nr:SsrA-binding protein SmpB [Bacteroidota bacterium]
MADLKNNITILNRRASFEYSFLEKYVAGLMLTGTEIKSIRAGKANINDGYCFFKNNELFIKNMHITEYEQGTYNNHEPNRDRKLLLNKAEINKLLKKLKDQGLTIVPLKLFISESGYAKLEIALAKGKKLFDKRDDIKKRDIQRETARKIK